VGSSRWNHVYIISIAMKLHETSIGDLCFISYEKSTKQNATSRWYDTPSKHKKWNQALEGVFYLYSMYMTIFETTKWNHEDKLITLPCWGRRLWLGTMSTFERVVVDKILCIHASQQDRMRQIDFRFMTNKIFPQDLTISFSTSNFKNRILLPGPGSKRRRQHHSWAFLDWQDACGNYKIQRAHAQPRPHCGSTWQAPESTTS
jgi:hypothetical protein